MSCAVPKALEPLLNVIVPVGVVLLADDETLAVKVTLDPALTWAEESVSVVVVVARKLAPTDRAAVIAIEHEPAPEQAPLHPAKMDPPAALAFKVTMVPLEKLALQVPGQLIPAGVLVIEPKPPPDNVTDS